MRTFDPPKSFPPRWLVITCILTMLVFGAAFFTYLGSELRRAYFGLAPLNQTVTYVKHPVLPKSVHVFIGPRSPAGHSVFAWVYEGEPDWLSSGHNLGQIGTAPSLQAAAKSFGTVHFTDAGVTIGSGNSSDPVVLSKKDLESTR